MNSRIYAKRIIDKIIITLSVMIILVGVAAVNVEANSSDIDAVKSTLGTVTSCILKQNGIDVQANMTPQGQIYGKVNSFNDWLYSTMEARYEGLAEEIYNSSTIDGENNQVILRWSASTIEKFMGYTAWLMDTMGGSEAQVGDPFEHIVDTPRMITVNGVNVVPWQTNLSSSGQTVGPLTDLSVFTSRGSLLAPDLAAYYQGTQNGANYKPRYTFIQTNGNSFTFASSLYAQQITDNENAYTWLRWSNGTNTRLFYRDWASGKVDFAIMPILFTDGTLGFCTYSWVVSGQSPNSFNGSSYSIYRFGRSGAYPKYTDSGSFTFSGNIINPDIIDTYNDKVYNVNNVDNITNNYIEGDDIFRNPYTDPGSWDTDTHINPNSDGVGGGWNIPFNMPDLNIDWNIGGDGTDGNNFFADKFPFSIPWDLARFFRIMNAQPETPRITGEIPLGNYSWEIDWSLTEFDGIAALLRNLEFIGFCITLVVATRHITSS